MSWILLFLLPDEEPAYPASCAAAGTSAASSVARSQLDYKEIYLKLSKVFKKNPMTDLSGPNFVDDLTLELNDREIDQIRSKNRKSAQQKVSV